MFSDLEFIKTCLNGLRSRIEKVEAQTADIQVLKAQVEEIRGTSAAPKDPYIVYSTDKDGAITAALYNFESIPDHLFSGEQIAKVDLSGSPNITSIGGYVFYGCTSLTSITIPESVTSIGSYAFYRCTGLTSITIPESVTSIGDNAFYGCTSLTSITIPESVTSIGSYAFNSCTGLLYAEIRAQTLGTGIRIFYSCTGLQAVWLRSTCLTITAASATNAPFMNCSNALKIYAEPSSALPGWGNYFNRTGSGGGTAVSVAYGQTTRPW